MFKDVETLKSFILWARKEGIKSFKVGEVEFEISPMLIEPVDPVDNIKALSKFDYKTLTETAEEELDKDDDDLLFYSSKP